MRDTNPSSHEHEESEAHLEKKEALQMRMERHAEPVDQDELRRIEDERKRDFHESMEKTAAEQKAEQLELRKKVPPLALCELESILVVIQAANAHRYSEVHAIGSAARGLVAAINQFMAVMRSSPENTIDLDREKP